MTAKTNSFGPIIVKKAYGPLTSGMIVIVRQLSRKIVHFAILATYL